MAITISQPAGEPRAFSIGPVKEQMYLWSSNTSADTSVVVTADALTTVAFAMLTGADQSTAASIVDNVVTFTIAQTAQQKGQIIIRGK
jgi:hypothetical protein